MAAAATQHDLQTYRRDLAIEVEALTWYMSVNRDASVCGSCASETFPTSRTSTRRDAKKNPPRQSQPRAFEARYRGQLVRRTRAIHRILVDQMATVLERIRPEINARARRRDAISDNVGDLLRIASEVQRATSVAFDPDLDQLTSLGAEVARFTQRAVDRQVREMLGVSPVARAALAERTPLPAQVPVQDTVLTWAAENVRLIKSIDSRYFDEVRDAVIATVGEGKSTRALAKLLNERFGVAKSRARLIAEDQIGKLNAQITQRRQLSLGIEEYEWSNVADQRVRKLHMNRSGRNPDGLGGTIRRWDQPHPTEGHPGEPVRCRCGALPVLG